MIDLNEIESITISGYIALVICKILEWHISALSQSNEFIQNQFVEDLSRKIDIKDSISLFIERSKK